MNQFGEGHIPNQYGQNDFSPFTLLKIWIIIIVQFEWKEKIITILGKRKMFHRPRSEMIHSSFS